MIFWVVGGNISRRLWSDLERTAEKAIRDSKARIESETGRCLVRYKYLLSHVTAD